MAGERRLGRGLDDLLAQHDQDLPFLDAYGPAMDAPDHGTTTEQMEEAIQRLLRAEGNDGANLTVEAREEGVKLTIRGEMLPLVPTDLGAPGMEGGDLAEDRSEARVTIVRWGAPVRRLLERMCEHWQAA